MADFVTGGAKAQNADVFIGKKISKYEIKSKIGQGAMGIILKVWDTLEEVYKAIKMVPPELSFDKLSFNQLKKEVNSSSKIIHPNVIKVMGLEEYQGLYFIVMEFIDGLTLADILADAPDGKLDEEIVVKYMNQICLGLNEAHKNGVIHLDLKPQNIMAKKNGEIKILDFSISHQITKSMTMLTGQNLSTGTLPYMAPEQLSKKFGRINEQTDIWGLGATMYHLLSGEVPFETDRQILDSEEEPYELETVSEKTKTIISGCLTKDRNERYKNINDVLNKSGFSVGTTENKLENIEEKDKKLITKSKPNNSKLQGDLAITTNVDCSIIINGKVFKTVDKYLFINDLGYGEIDLKAEADGLNIVQNIQINKKLSKISLELKQKIANLYAKSKIGEFELIINNNTYKCPELIESIPEGRYKIEIIYKGKHFEEMINLSFESTTIYELTKEKLKTYEKKNEKVEWEKISITENISFYEKYLSKYPEGEFKDKALEKILKLEEKQEELKQEELKQKEQKQKELKHKELEALKVRKEREQIAKREGKIEFEKIIREIYRKIPELEANAIYKKSISKNKKIEYDQKTDNVVIDITTELMWHRSGSEKELNFQEAEEWLIELNAKEFAGYYNWRLPTLEEGTMLLKENKSKNRMFISDLFSSKQNKIWTGDCFGISERWFISFFYGSIGWDPNTVKTYVRPVRNQKSME